MPYAEGFTEGAMEVEWALEAPPGLKSSARSQGLSARKPGGLGTASLRQRRRQAREGQRKPRCNGLEKSDADVVPKKSANSRVTPEESMEERNATKENAAARNTRRTQGRVSVPTYLQQLGERASKDKGARFTNLFCHLKVPLLKDAYARLQKRAAPGVDLVDWKSYGEKLEDNLRDLQDRLHRNAYHPPPVRRVRIPKPDGRERPLGIPTIEDKVVQQAVRMLLEPIYEKQFLGFSHGFRPGRSTHDALDALAVAITKERTNWILDADIADFFGTIHHERLKKILEERIGDRRLVRLIVRWLNAGVWEDGRVEATEEGTPQGGVISPLLSNVFLHHVLDQWAHAWRRQEAKRRVYIVRYADDFVVGFQNGSDARIFRAQLRRRLEEYGLALHDEKTRLIRFGRFARPAGNEKAQKATFDFLGFTHIGAKGRDGSFHLLRHTSKKKRTAKYAMLREELRRRRHAPVKETHRWLNSVLRGHYNYYGVPGNERALRRFRHQVRAAWYRQLSRRSQRGRKTVVQWKRFEQRYELLRPEIVHPWPEQRFALR